MDSFTSLRATMFFMLLSSSVLAGTFYYVWRYCLRKRHVLLWSVAWAVAVPHLTLEIYLLDHPHEGLARVSSVIPLLVAVLKLAGCLEIVGRPLRARLLGAALAPFGLWAVIGPTISNREWLIALPGALLLGGSYLWTAMLFLRRRDQRQLLASRPVGILFVLIGLHELDYPLLMHLPGFNSMGYLVAAVLALANSFSLLVMILEQSRSDIDQQRARMGAILDNLPVGVLVTSPQGETLHANAAVQQFLPRAVPGVHRTVAELEDAIFIDQVSPPITLALREGETCRGREMSVRTADGGQIPALVNVGPVRDERGQLVGAVAVLLDLSEQKRMQEEMARSERLKGLGTLAAGVAHDFNNALTMILGHAEIARGGSSDPVVRKQLQIIADVAADSASIVRRIQDLARTRVNRETQVFQLASIVQEVVDLSRPRWRDQAQAAGISYTVQTDLAADLAISGQQAELREALLNLLLNALDAMPQGGTLSLKVERDGDLALLEVSDTGTGIAEEVRRHIFDPFFTTKGQAGTGLGLAVVYSIISRHGGDVRVDSRPGHGTTFRVRLPIATAAPATAKLVAVAPRERPKLRLLVAEDEPLVRTLTQTLLQREGHEVVACEDGESALKAFTVGGFDGVLTDLGMPGLNGWQVARAVADSPNPVPVILVTGWGDTVSPEQAASAGIAVVLPKPFTPKQLLASIAGVTRVDAEVACAGRHVI